MLRLALPLAALVALLGCDPTTPSGSIDTFELDTEADIADCREIFDGRTICFPEGHTCYDPHGIGDGVPVEIDCHTGGSRMCHPNSELWPDCAGGWEE
jgi:hypothetical protein